MVLNADTIMYFLMSVGMPSVYYYHLFTENVFLNTEASDATGLEKMGNMLLAPSRYLFAGKKAELIDAEDHIYTLKQDYQYDDKFMWPKTVASLVACPFSLIGGTLVKGTSLLFEESRKHHRDLVSIAKSRKVQPNLEYYKRLGMKMDFFSHTEWISSPKYQRRPGDENHLMLAKEALKEIVTILTENHIPYWLECGSCLGAYRYGGVIPWDIDIDLGILQADFENVKNALHALPSEKYVVQDWSSRDKPGTYLKVYARKAKVLIDIYHYGIDEKNKEIYYIISNENSVFLPESWKARERYTTHPLSFDVMFPLKKAMFDGIEVFVPRKTKKFLQSKYGEDISPIKVYNEKTGEYEKDLSHPYWERAYVQ